MSAYAIYFGFILISVSAIFYVAAKCENYSPVERVLILVSSFVICQIIGYSLLLGGKLLILGQGFILLGEGLYGASVVLLGQIFNVPVKWSQGTFIWLVGVLAILLVVDFFLLRVIFFAGVLASLFSRCGLFFDSAACLFGEFYRHSLFFRDLIVLSLIIVLGLYLLRRKKVVNS